MQGSSLNSNLYLHLSPKKKKNPVYCAIHITHPAALLFYIFTCVGTYSDTKMYNVCNHNNAIVGSMTYNCVVVRRGCYCG